MHLVFVNPRAQATHRRLPLSVLFAARGAPPGCTWSLHDANVDPQALAEAEAHIARDPAHTLLLVTVMPGPQLREATPWCRALKARYPALRVVWGGYFASVYPDAVARDRGVDLVVIGQAEETLPELVAALRSELDPAAVPGVAAWRDGALVRGPPRAMAVSSSFGLAAYERLDPETYAAPTFLGRRTVNHHSSVGCPYVCNFCAVTSVAQGRWLADPADEVLRAVRALKARFSADALEFHDNNFFAAEGRVRQVAEGLTPLKMRWWGEGRIDTMLRWPDATWRAMADSGLAMVFFGAESGDQDALDAMDKGGLQVGDTLSLNRKARGFGVIPEFSFVLGNPADPEGDIDRSIGLIERLKADNPSAEIILYVYTPVPLPGQLDQDAAQGFTFPDDLDGWLSPRWHGFEDRRDPGTPWLEARLVQRIRDFEAVLHARWPSVSDRNLARWQRRLLSALAGPRVALRRYHRPVLLQGLQRLWHYRRPEQMGF